VHGLSPDRDRAAADPSLGPARLIGEELDRRLMAEGRTPLALGLSGGGDSVALLLAAATWARAHGRPLLALTVDHGLQPQSAAWTEACAKLAARTGVGFRALAWTGDKPRAGLAAAARDARHRLLAETARAAGAKVILLGHTADDRLEAQAMRRAGSTTPTPREWSPSPAWPEGRGLFLLRPMLGLRRAALRAWLESRGQAWIEDPANIDPASPRARARAGLDPATPLPPAEVWAPLALARICEALPGGGFRLPRSALAQGAEGDRRRLIALACVCAGGGGRLPAGCSTAAIADRLQAGERFTAVLAGARLRAEAEDVLIVREAGEAARGGLAPLPLEPGRPVVWDGRYEALASRPDLELRALAGRASRLPPQQRAALALLPAPCRPSLPVTVDRDGAVSCPLLQPGPATLASLPAARLAAAAGLIETEAAIGKGTA
jgi:tRNA(Ile)-lysidine synthase